MTRRHTILGRCLALVGGIGALAGPLEALTIAVTSQSAVPNSSINVCFSMNGGAGVVAGLQLDASCDASCAEPETTDGSHVLCDVNVEKTLQTKTFAPSSFRAVVYSLADTAPITRDGELFCCAFTVKPDLTTRDCRIDLSTVIASDSRGNRLPVTPQAGTIHIFGTPPPSPTPTPRPTESSAGSCSVQPSRDTSGAATVPLMLLLPAVLWLSRRRHRFGRNRRGASHSKDSGDCDLHRRVPKPF